MKPGMVTSWGISSGREPVPSREPPLPTGGRPPKLLDQVRLKIRTLHYSPRTEKTYVHWIRQYIRFHGLKHPKFLGEKEIGRFLSSLATEGRVSSSKQNQALNAVLFLYRKVLGKEIPWIEGVDRAKRPAAFRWFCPARRCWQFWAVWRALPVSW